MTAYSYSDEVPRYSDVKKEYDLIPYERRNYVFSMAQLFHPQAKAEATGGKLLPETVRKKILKEASSFYKKYCTFWKDDSAFLLTYEFKAGNYVVEFSANIEYNKESVSFAAYEGEKRIALFDILRSDIENWKQWELFHREVIPPYTNAGQSNSSVANTVMRAIDIFLQKNCDDLGEGVQISAEVGQPYVGLKLVKHGYQPINWEQEKRWNHMLNPNKNWQTMGKLEMRHRGFVFDVDTNPTLDGLDYSYLHSYRVELAKHYKPQK